MHNIRLLYSSSIIDLFIYNPTYRVWICTSSRYRYAVSPQTLLSHLRTRYPSHTTASTHAGRQDALAQMLKQPWIDLSQDTCLTPSP